MPETHFNPIGSSPRCALVTGGFGTLGTAVTEAFLREGYRVARVNHAAVPTSAASANSIGIGPIDLANCEEAREAVATALTRLGALHVVVNAAGGFAWEVLSDTSPATWARLHALNVQTCLNTCVAALPHLKDGSRIINIGAMAEAGAGMGAYTAAKSAVARLTESLAAEVRTRGVTVNAVLPGTIDTPQNRRSMPDTEPAHWTRPEAIAEVILFLASPASHAINGALIPVTNAC